MRGFSHGRGRVVLRNPTLVTHHATRSPRPAQVSCDVAQWQSARLLSGETVVRVHPSQPRAPPCTPGGSVRQLRGAAPGAREWTCSTVEALPTAHRSPYAAKRRGEHPSPKTARVAPPMPVGTPTPSCRRIEPLALRCSARKRRRTRPKYIRWLCNNVASPTRALTGDTLARTASRRSVRDRPCDRACLPLGSSRDDTFLVRRRDGFDSRERLHSTRVSSSSAFQRGRSATARRGSRAWSNGRVRVFQTLGCGFESRCSLQHALRALARTWSGSSKVERSVETREVRVRVPPGPPLHLCRSCSFRVWVIGDHLLREQAHAGSNPASRTVAMV
jgi:hypothetical protein